MPSKSSLAATVVAALLTLLIGGVLGVFQFDSASAASSPTPGTGLLRFGNSYSQAAGPDRYSYVIVGRGDATKAAALPGKSLVYHSGTSVNTIWDTGVPYSVANANGWLLKDSAGVYLKNVNYPDNYIGDVGSSAYQAEWARRVGDYLASVGADGVYIDDVIADIYAMSAKYPANYPNQASWENAMASFIAYIGPTLKARGFYVLLNAHKFISGNSGSNNGSLEAQWWQRLGPSVSGLHNEYFMQSATNTSQFRGEGTAWYDNWTGWANLINVAQSMGRDFVGLTYGSTTNVQAMRYVRATHLLFWNGAGGALTYQVTNGDPWHAEWTIAIGTPTASRYQVGSGWRREYTGGTVLVNPSLTVSQTFALGATYLMPDGSSVTSAALAPKSGLILRSSGSGGTTPPANTAPPTISGTAQEGLAQASTTGTWSGSPTTYAHQWQRCDSTGGACGAIAGATAPQYMLAVGDVGKTVRATVTASNAGGSSSATSSASAVIASAPVVKPVNTALPAISGTAQQGNTFTGSTGSWSNSPTSYAYQWQRCDSAGAACVTVAGATSSPYVLTSSDVGKTLRVAVTAANAGGSTSAVSAASAIVAAAPVSKPVNTALPAISGTAQQGSTFTASNGSWSNSPTSYAYQWQRCDGAGAACVTISGATSSTFGLTSADVGKTLRVVVTASNAGGSTSVTSAASAIVAPPPGPAPVNTGLPVVNGSDQVGKTVSTSVGSWSGSPTSYAYQWLRCTGATIASCVPILGATKSTYTFTSADYMTVVVVRVTASNTYGSASATSKMGMHVRA